MENKFKGVRNVNGRPKGAVNKNTANTKAVIQKLVNHELEGLPELMAGLKPKDKAELLVKLLPYVIPRINHLEVRPAPEAIIIDWTD